jgi:hypothetical protein
MLDVIGAITVFTVAASVITSPVPADAQRAITTKVAAQVRYVPTRAPNGYRYAKWRGGGSSLEIDFARKSRPPTLTFLAGVSGPAGTCTAGGTRTYRFGSMRVFFEKDRYVEQFWRCAHAGSVSIEATIRRTDGITAAKREAIAAMVASAKRLG